MDPGTLKGVAIVSVEGAARLGRVKDVLFDTGPLRVVALLAVDESGESTVPFDRVSSFGSDAVMVETADASEHSPQPSNHLRSLAGLQTLKVVDETGKYVGTVKTVDFDPDSGHVERLVAETGGVLGRGGTKTTVEAQHVRSVGSDLLTISSNREPSASTD
jgi:sporulation protein YlmC with PRC-barrel domain